MSSPIIEIEGLAKSYRGVPAVRDVSLTVEEGEIFALLGPNGAGKTTARCVKLSGGQRRRLDLALGLVGNPSLLLLDEPTTGFDPEARRAFWELIRSLSRQGMTILLTTHYLDEAEYLADRVGVIAGGRVLEINTPGAIGGRDTSGTRVQWRGRAGRHQTHLHLDVRTRAVSTPRH